MRKFTLRLVILGLFLGYAGYDVFGFHGPLRRQIDRLCRFGATSEGGSGRVIVAQVLNYAITRSQLERAVSERLWLEGKRLESISHENRKALRYESLTRLIDQELLRMEAKASMPQLVVGEEEIHERMRRMLGRFESKGEMESTMKSQGISSERELRNRLAENIRQEKYVELKIAPMVKVSDGEARRWFSENQTQLAYPERILVRHIFIATLDRPAAVAKARLDAVLTDLRGGKKDFAQLAREFSEDPASKESGGFLGWMTRERLPEDFSREVFAMATGRPQLVQTRLGWHLVEVTRRMATSQRTYEHAKAEVIAALEAIKRRQAARDFRDSLHKRNAKNIEIFHEMMTE